MKPVWGKKTQRNRTNGIFNWSRAEPRTRARPVSFTCRFIVRMAETGRNESGTRASAVPTSSRLPQRPHVHDYLLPHLSGLTIFIIHAPPRPFHPFLHRPAMVSRMSPILRLRFSRPTPSPVPVLPDFPDYFIP